ncbi:MAG TPA: asparagine synthase (glutamine-hydrolyzing) [Polyangiaceae bacterium]
MVLIGRGGQASHHREQVELCTTFGQRLDDMEHAERAFVEQSDGSIHRDGVGRRGVLRLRRIDDMCGIAGIWSFRGGTHAELSATAQRMATALAHRGPDDAGVWVDPSAGIALGHRRLSIVDLSPLGHQPMTSASGRFVLTYNGEIYNFESLRSELAGRGHTFRGHSDTEVLLAAVEEWGASAALQRFNGMFAIALWDARDRALTLARDRFGEKPLYYGLSGDSLLFASELKAFRGHSSFRPRIDRSSLAQYLRYAYVPTPRTIFEGVRKLRPGASIRITDKDGVAQTPQSFWSLVAVAQRAEDHRFGGSDEEAIAELDETLRRSIRLRMIADVPLGAFLSGGIDSSTVVALMQAQSLRPVKTFTIGFHEAAYNEAGWAKAVAAHLGTDHTELYVTPDETRAVIPRLPAMYDEPFADASQIPTFLVSQLARRDVTVALSGDGGDELFGGYTRYAWAPTLWRPLSRVPAWARDWAAGVLRLPSPGIVDRALQRIDGFLPERLRQRTPAEKLQKAIDLLGAKSQDDVYFHLVSTWRDPSAIARVQEAPHEVLQNGALPLRSFTERMMCADGMTYLPDDILVKLDRAAMSVHLESRAPMLDHDLADFAWRLPTDMKIRAGAGKWILREVLARYVPRALFERPKAGFGVPVGPWLRGPLRGWAEACLAQDRLRREGYLEPTAIRETWAAHLAGRTDASFRLWIILMFQAWLEEWG